MIGRRARRLAVPYLLRQQGSPAQAVVAIASDNHRVLVHRTCREYWCCAPRRYAR